MTINNKKEDLRQIFLSSTTNRLVVYDDKDIHSLSSVMREKVRDLPLNMCFTLQDNSCNNILKCTMGCCMLTLARALKQIGT